MRASGSRGGGSFADLGLGVVAAAGSLFPFVPTDYRVVLVMVLLFALSNAVEARSHFADGERRPMPLSHRDPEKATAIAGA